MSTATTSIHVSLLVVWGFWNFRSCQSRFYEILLWAERKIRNLLVYLTTRYCLSVVYYTIWYNTVFFTLYYTLLYHLKIWDCIHKYRQMSCVECTAIHIWMFAESWFWRVESMNDVTWNNRQRLCSPSDTSTKWYIYAVSCILLGVYRFTYAYCMTYLVRLAVVVQDTTHTEQKPRVWTVNIDLHVTNIHAWKCTYLCMDMVSMFDISLLWQLSSHHSWGFLFTTNSSNRSVECSFEN